jgi:hypothetical protein
VTYLAIYLAGVVIIGAGYCAYHYDENKNFGKEDMVMAAVCISATWPLTAPAYAMFRLFLRIVRAAR